MDDGTDFTSYTVVCIMTKSRKLKREEIVAREWHV